MLRTFSHNLALAVMLALLHVTLASTPMMPASTGSGSAGEAQIAPKQYYLALGDSLAFGYQPDLDYTHGYADDVFNALQARGTRTLVNLGCPGETSETFIGGRCPYPFLRKFPYFASQLAAALAFLHQHAGQVSPVTLDIGANDLLPDVAQQTCTVNAGFTDDLATLDAHLVQTILPQLHHALGVNGHLSGQLLLLTYYDPFENRCPASAVVAQLANAHLKQDMRGFGGVVDVYSAFGGSAAPNLCATTWMCSPIFPDIHPTALGYRAMAAAIVSGLLQGGRKGVAAAVEEDSTPGDARCTGWEGRSASAPFSSDGFF